MARLLRTILPNLPHHVVQRGHNRDPTFLSENDFQIYCDYMRVFRDRVGLQIYAFCLMPNHVHLIIDPGDYVSSISDFMMRLSGRYSSFMNQRLQRRGTLWDGRFRSSPIQSDRYLQACCRYVEMNPVRANIVTSPERYRWSSYCERAGLAGHHWLDEDPCYSELGETRADRERRYRTWFHQFDLEPDLETIQNSIEREEIIADDSYRLKLENQTGRSLQRKLRGRPSKAGNRKEPQ